jgi:hypothetical protein
MAAILRMFAATEILKMFIRGHDTPKVSYDGVLNEPWMNVKFRKFVGRTAKPGPYFMTTK